MSNVLFLENQDDVDKPNISMSVKEERGHSSNVAPDLRKAEVMSDSNDSEIEEVGRKIAPATARHHRVEMGEKSRPGRAEDHSRILSSSFNWGPTANFTSTLDIDAIKVQPKADCFS